MPSKFGYGVAIDAGSSGSRLYLYRWPLLKPNDDPSPDASSFVRVEPAAIFSEERTPGIGDADGLGIAHLSELVSSAEAALPPGVDPSDVPIYLGATAGMRIVEPSFEAGIMSRVRSMLRASNFHFEDDSRARTIPGEEEGAYDWLAANYLRNGGDLPPPSPSSPASSSPPSGGAYGALDLGGASAQISFPAPAMTMPLHVENDAQRFGSTHRKERATMTMRDDAEDRFPLRVDDVDYPLFSRSFLYYGVDQARKIYDETHVARESNSSVSPCYPSGYEDPDTNISGSSDWERCLHSVGTLFDRCRGKRCLSDDGDSDMHHLPIIREDQRFIAMSAFVYTYDYLGLNIGPETDDLNTLNSRAGRVCNLDMKQQLVLYEKRMETELDKDRRTTRPWAQCFNAAFSYHLLSKGYSMPTKDTPIEIYHDIDGTKVQWALGFMLVEANRHRGHPVIVPAQGGRRQLGLGEVDMYGGMSMTYSILMMISATILGMAVARLSKRGKQLRTPSPCNGELCLPVLDPCTVIEGLSRRKGI